MARPKITIHSSLGLLRQFFVGRPLVCAAGQRFILPPRSRAKSTSPEKEHLILDGPLCYLLKKGFLLISIFDDDQRRGHLRLIPEIEKSPRLRAFAETLYGQFILSLLFLVVLYSFGQDRTYLQFSYTQLLAIFCLGFFPGPILRKLFVGIALTFLAGPRPFLGLMATETDQLVLARDSFLRLNEWIAKAPLLYCGAFGIFCLLFWLCLLGLRKIQSRFPVIWLFYVWIALIVLALNIPPVSDGSAMAWMTVGTFSVCLFSTAYFHAAQFRLNFLGQTTFVLQTILMSPPFTVIRHPGLLAGKMPKSVCQLKALKLIIWARLIAALADQINFYLFTKLHWAHYNTIGLANYNALHLSWYQVLITRLSQTLLLLLNLSVNTGIGISIFRLAGIYLPRAVCRPYLARSFNDYFRRCLFYYSETILHLFFFPIYAKLETFVSNPKWRMQIALFASLFVGGWIFHVVISWQSFFFFGSESSLKNAFGWLLYFALVAGVCCLSATNWLSQKLLFVPRPIHLILNFLTHTILLSFIQYSLGETIEDRINLIRSMWPIAR